MHLEKILKRFVNCTILVNKVKKIQVPLVYIYQCRTVKVNFYSIWNKIELSTSNIKNYIKFWNISQLCLKCKVKECVLHSFAQKIFLILSFLSFYFFIIILSCVLQLKSFLSFLKVKIIHWKEILIFMYVYVYFNRKIHKGNHTDDVSN